jgi:glucan 1,3-beta-glucosidase
MSIPSVENAEYFLNSFICEAKIRNVEYYYHEAFDADWKSGLCNITDQEFHWGIFNSNRTVKFYVERALDCDNLVSAPVDDVTGITVE